jgi:hypothetical protein
MRHKDAAEAAKNDLRIPAIRADARRSSRDFSSFKLDFVGDLSNPFAL